MISLNYKSFSEFNQLNETVPELFRLSAKVQLAETISFIDPIPTDSIDVLINSCIALLPNRRYLNVEVNDEHLRQTLNTNPTLMTSLVSIRSQESVIALSHLYKCSNGIVDDRVVSILTSFLTYLTYSDFTSSTDIEHANNFTFYLVRQLAMLSHIPGVARDMIVPSFIDFFTQIVHSNNIPVMYGTLTALGEPNRFLYHQDELNRVISIIESIMTNQSNQKNSKFNQKKCLLLVCKSFEQITHLPQEQVDCEIYRKLYNNVFPYTSTLTDNETFISIINVIVRCGILDASIGKEVLDYVIRFVQETKNLNSSEVAVSLNRPHSELLYITILTSLVDLCDKYSDKSIRVIEVMKEFIQQSRIPKHSDTIRLTLIESVCRILKNEHRKERGIEVCKTVITSLINTMHLQYSEYSIAAGDVRSRSPSMMMTNPPNPDALSNIITCLGRITCVLNDAHIIDMILPNFMSRVTYPPSGVENLILEQLTDIALLGYSSITKDIVVLITKLFKKICRDPNQGVITNITPNTLQRLAKDLRSEDLRQDLCKRVLKLFQQLGKTLKREELGQKLASPILKGMGFLLPTIAELIKVPIREYQQPPTSTTSTSGSGSSLSVDTTFNIQNSNEASNMRLFRSVWFYCVLFKFSTPGTWRSDWRECVQVIASHLMPLVSTKSHLHLEMELELDSIIKQGFDKDYFVELRTRLGEILPNHTHVIKNLTFSQAAYVYSVYTLETMRFSMSHSFKIVFSYLEDQSIENIYVSSCIRGIADKVFNDFLGTYLSVSPSLCERVLADHASFLLIKFCYPYQPVRKASDESISSLVARFPQILWNRECLGTLLDLIEVIGQAAKTKPMDMISIKLPATDHVIELPDETPARHRLLQEVVELGNVWLKNGAEVAPVEIQEQLQEYMQRFNNLSRNHIGFSLAVEIGSIDNTAQAAQQGLASGTLSAIGNKLTGNTQDSAKTLASAYPICYNSNAANFVSTLQLKALYSGEVNGMINMMMVDQNDSSSPGEEEKLNEIVEDLAFFRLIEEFEKLIEQHRRGKSVDSLAFSSIMYRSCAFLINHYFGQSVKLIHMVCYAPAFIFTPDSMQVGVTAWKWLLAERDDLTQFIMTSISDVWSWTVNQRIGLFTNTERDPSPLAISTTPSHGGASGDSTNPSDTSSSSNQPNIDTMMGGVPARKMQERHSHIPHKIMINFLEERYSIVKFSSKEQIDIIIAMLLKAIADPSVLSVSPRSLATRFKLLLLCMSFIQGDLIPDITLVKLMRERVYLCALGWFYLPPIWYGQNESSGELQGDTKILIDFCKALQTEPIFQYLEKRHTISFNRASVATSTPSVNYNTLRNGRPSSDRLTNSNASLPSVMTPSTSTLGLGQSSSYYGSVNGIKGLAINNNHMNGTAAAASTSGVSVGSGLSGAVGLGLANQYHPNQPGTPSLNGSGALANSTGSSTPSMSSMGTGSIYSSQFNSVKMDVIGSGVGTMTTSSSKSFLVSQTLLDTLKSGDRPLQDKELEELRRRRNLILLLVGNELERMSAWNNPINRINQQIPEQLKFSYDNLPKTMKSSWKEYLVASWRINPRLAIHFSSRFQHTKIRRILSEMVVKNTKSVLAIPEALPLLVTEENVARDIPELKYLLYWETVTPPMAISLLGKPFRSHPLVIQYACRVLRNFPPETIMFYIPQLVQALRYDRTGLVENYLVAASKTSELLAHQIIWNVQTYTEADPNTDRTIDDPAIQEVARRLKTRIIAEMDPSAYENYKSEFDFFESFTAISGRLLREHKDPIKRKTQLHEDLRLLSNNYKSDPNNPLYLPTNPKSIVVGLEITSAMTLQSAAKVPILVNFKVLERRLPSGTPSHIEPRSPSPSNSPLMGPTTISSTTNTASIIPNILKSQSPKLPSTTNIIHLRESSRIRKSSRRVIQEAAPQTNNISIQGCIFKSGDDTRQDILALQVIDLFKRIFTSVGLDLYLFPYKVIATKPGCGMIELVPNTMSRDQIGKKVNGSLYDYFISRYGHKNSIGFQNARRNFIKSMAAYSVVSYILQIKDRHNANILVDEEGHLVHIDFGFIFDISPGGDMITFEASPFKLSQEMIDIMGGKPNAEQFTWFMEQSVRAFLAARQHMDSIITLVELMLDTKLPCFKEQTITHLRQRFCPYKSETYAAKFMTKVVLDSFSAISSFSTYFYDVFQLLDNGIEM